MCVGQRVIACMLCANILMLCVYTYSHGLTTACGTYHYMMREYICPFCTTAYSDFWKQRNRGKKEHTHAPDPNGKEQNKDPFCCRPFLSYLVSKFARSILPEWQHNSAFLQQNSSRQQKVAANVCVYTQYLVSYTQSNCALFTHQE